MPSARPTPGPTPAPHPTLGVCRLPFSGTSSWRSLAEVRRRENRKRKLGGFFMGKMVWPTLLPSLGSREAAEKKATWLRIRDLQSVRHENSFRLWLAFGTFSSQRNVSSYLFFLLEATAKRVVDLQLRGRDYYTCSCSFFVR